MVTCMLYKSKVMDRLAMAEYLSWKKTWPDLKMGEQLDWSGLGQLWDKVIRTDVMSQKLLPE